MEENNNTQQTTNNPVSLKKPEKPEQPEQQAQSVSFGGQPTDANMNTNMNTNPSPVSFGGQPMNLNNPNMNSNPNPVSFGGQPMNLNNPNMNPNSNPVNFGVQPMDSNMNLNSNPVSFGGQPMNLNNPNMNPNMNSNSNPVNFGGQPMNQNMNQGYNINPNYVSNQYGGQPSNTTQGLQYAQPKKSKAGLFIGITAVVLIALVAVIGVVFSRSMLGGAKNQMEKGYANMAKEMLAYNSSLSDEVGFDEIRKLTNNGTMNTNIDLTLTVSDRGESASVGLDILSDINNKKGKADISIGKSGLNLNVGTITVDDNIMYLGSDFVSDGQAYSIDLTTLGKDYNNSVWADYFNESVPDDLSYDLFAEFDNDIETDDELVEIFTNLNKNMSKSASYSKISKKKEFEVGGETVACSGVSVTYDKDAFNEMIKEFSKEFLDSDYFDETLSQVESADDVREVFELLLDVELENDYVINYYLDKKGRIVNISTPSDVKIKVADSEGSFSIDINFSGKERTLDVIDGGIWIGNDDDIIYIGVSRQASVTSEQYSEDFSIMFQQSNSNDDISVNYKNSWNYDDKSFDMSISLNTVDETMEFSADGEFKDIDKGKSYTLNVRNASIKDNGKELLSGSCTISVEPSNEAIEVPDDAVEFFKMSDDDIYSMFGSVFGSLGSFY